MGNQSSKGGGNSGQSTNSNQSNSKGSGTIYKGVDYSKYTSPKGQNLDLIVGHPSGYSYPSNSNNQSSGSGISGSTGFSGSGGGYSVPSVSYKDIITDAKNGSLFLYGKVMNMSNTNLKNEDVGVLVQYLQYQQLNLDRFDVSNNQLGYGAVESLFYTFSLSRSNTALYNIKYINISHNFIGDDGAKYIASHLSNGQHPNLKAIDLSDNQITNTGHGYIAKALNAVNQAISVTFTKLKDVSKTTLKETMKGMVFIAKNNGISTKEMLTTDETIEHCKKGTFNVAKNIAGGILKCIKTPVKYLTPKDVTLQDVGLDTLYILSKDKYVKATLTFMCISQGTVFSVVDEDFTNCLIGVDSLLND